MAYIVMTYNQERRRGDHVDPFEIVPRLFAIARRIHRIYRHTPMGNTQTTYTATISIHGTLQSYPERRTTNTHQHTPPTTLTQIYQIHRTHRTHHRAAHTAYTTVHRTYIYHIHCIRYIHRIPPHTSHTQHGITRVVYATQATYIAYIANYSSLVITMI